MKLLAKDGEELASVQLSRADDGKLSTHVEAGELELDAPPIKLSTEKSEDGLIADVHLEGLAHCKILLEKGDIKALKGLMNKDAIGFFLKALTSKG